MCCSGLALAKISAYELSAAMARQLATYEAAATASPRMRPCSSDDDNHDARPTTARMVTVAAGANRRSRRAQKARNDTVPLRSSSLTSRLTMRYPDSVKKSDTPRNPPGNHVCSA